MIAWWKFKRSEGQAGRRLGLWLAATGLLLLVSLFGGCSSVGYLAHTAHGHFSLLASARQVDDWLAAPETSPQLKAQLSKAQAMRRFAVEQLALPDNRSYTRYAELGRPAAVWNVVAAPELSLRLKTWCFPVVGCVGYRGYFDLEKAQAAAVPLQEEGLETSVYAVPAYSTLGWGDWLGGDPLLSSFISWPESELARMIFHELSHQVVYAPGDTAFNESYATAVERLGLQRWLARPGNEKAASQAKLIEQRRADYRALTSRTRQALEAVYASDQDPQAKRQAKADIMQRMRDDYAALKVGAWNGFAGYDEAVAKANNASLALQAAYLQWVPAFEALFRQEGEDFARFHRQVGLLAALPAEQRQAELEKRLPKPAPE